MKGAWSAPGRTAAEFLEGLEGWVRTRCADTICATGVGQDHSGRHALRLLFHPAGDSFVIAASDDGTLEAGGDTSPVGPGLHAYLVDLARAIDRDFRVGWRDVSDETGYWETSDRAALEDAMLRWIEEVARALRKAASEGSTGFMLSLPAGESYEHDGLVATALGPRDASWVEAVAAGGEPGRRRAREHFAWWEPGVDARQELSRALVLLWVDVRWREALTDDEAGVQAEAARLLERAFRRDASLELPWREWRELLALLGAEGELAREVARRADAVSADLPKIGYRRRNVRVTLPGGWTIDVPGSCVLEYQDEGRTFVAWEGGRTAWVSSLELRDRAGRPVPAARILADERAKLEGEPLRFEGERVCGHAAFARERSGDPPAWTLDGRSAVDGSLAITTIAVERDADRPWAIATWQSLDRPERA